MDLSKLKLRMTPFDNRLMLGEYRPLKGTKGWEPCGRSQPVDLTEEVLHAAWGWVKTCGPYAIVFKDGTACKMTVEEISREEAMKIINGDGEAEA